MNTLSRLSANHDSFYNQPIELTPEQPTTDIELAQAWDLVAIDGPIDDQTIMKLLQLCKSGFDPFEHNLSQGMSFFQKAVENGNTDIVRLILNLPEQLSEPHRQAFKMRIKSGIEATHGYKEDSPLHVASAKGYLDIFRMLIGAGASIYTVNGCNETPLHIATLNGQEAIVSELILASQSDPNYLNTKGGISNATALVFAAGKGFVDILNLLISAGASVFISSVGGWTPLSIAALLDEKDIVKALICATGSDKAYLDSRSELGGETALHIASRKGHISSVRILLRAGASINIKDKFDKTPLDVAAVNGQISVLWKLIITDIKRNLKLRNYSFASHIYSSDSHIRSQKTLVEFINQGLDCLEYSIQELESGADAEKPKHFNYMTQMLTVLLECEKKYPEIFKDQLHIILQELLEEDILFQASENLIKFFNAKVSELKLSGGGEAARALLMKTENHKIALRGFETSLKLFSFDSEPRKAAAEKYFKQFPKWNSQCQQLLKGILDALNRATAPESTSSSSTNSNQKTPSLRRQSTKRVDRENERSTNEILPIAVKRLRH